MGDSGVFACGQQRVNVKLLQTDPRSALIGAGHLYSKQGGFFWHQLLWEQMNYGPGLTLTWLNLGKNKLATVSAEVKTRVAVGPHPRPSPA